MGSREDLDIDDDFHEIYKAYTGPMGSNAPIEPQRTTKRSHAGSDEEEEQARDPNVVPTDFTSREAKVWEAKSKATERNWKKRKEEEMICKICGESGHFTQGCPTTLGANRKSQDFFERVPAVDSHVKALFSEDVVNKIEKDIGCKIKIEGKFIIVRGKDRLILKKGIDAVHKIKEEGENKGFHKYPEDGECKGSSSSPILRSRSFEHRSPVTSRLGRSGSQKSNPSPRHAAHIPHRYGRQEKGVEDRVREDLQKLSSGSTHAYGSDGGRGRSSHSKSPAHTSNVGKSFNSYDGHPQNRSSSRGDGWSADRGGSNMQPGSNIEYPSFPQTLEELEFQYKREAMELAELQDKEEDDENFKHREAVQEMRENFMRKVAALKVAHANMWEEFLQLHEQRRQQTRQHIPESGFAGYKQPSFQDFDSSGNHYHSGPGMHSRGSVTSVMTSGNLIIDTRMFGEMEIGWYCWLAAIVALGALCLVILSTGTTPISNNQLPKEIPKSLSELTSQEKRLKNLDFVAQAALYQTLNDGVIKDIKSSRSVTEMGFTSRSITEI
ncbi:Zinc knuckle family protein [Perilla frutescens var. hirtella]|uniref:Zinc knuckle family protein n=1 Tax=Perilla frutescens var. hirtella TaxID=608512 RepID=A0AAD4IVD8_PERFH|nr:Zinc knuckle family protein [Perilla frutescens var. hirtella]